MKFKIDLTNPEFKVCRGGTTLKDGLVSTQKEQQGSFVTDSAKADEIHDALKYLHLLPDGYEFCTEEEAESWVKVEFSKDRSEMSQSKLGNVVYQRDISIFGVELSKVYRPIRKIKQPSIGYVTCTRNGIVPESEIPEGLKKLMQEVKSNPYQVDWSNAPEWADVHAFYEDGEGYWGGFKKRGNDWYLQGLKSTFTLPSGLDWRQSKRRRPI